MKAQRLLGLFFIVMGLLQIFHAIYERAAQGHKAGTFYTFVTALLLTAGVALLCRPDRINSKV